MRLLGVLAALFIGVFCAYVPLNPWAKPKLAPPPKERVLAFLDGQTIPPPAATDASGKEQKPLVLKREQIEELEVKAEDTFFTSVKFVVKADGGRYSVVGTINQGILDSDQTPVFYTFRGRIVSRQ